MTLQQIVDQLRYCEFTCEAGKLETNAAFQELEKRAKSEDLFYRILANDNDHCNFELHVTTPCDSEPVSPEELDNIRVE